MAARALPLVGLLAVPAGAQPVRPTLAIGITQYPSTLHPNIESMAAKAYALGFVRRPLTAYDADWRLVCLACETLPTLENGLAVRETTPDGKPGLRVTYRLRAELRWADGTPVTAADLRFAWEAGRNPETGFGGAEFYRSAYELLVVDERTVTLRFDKVTFQFASVGELQPLPERLERARWTADPRTYRSRSAYETEPTNPGLWSGPYRVAAVQPGAGLTLDRNPHWAGAAPAFERIRLRTVENTAALEAQLLAAQLDMIAGEVGLPVEQVAALERRAGSRFRMIYRPGLVFEHIDLNHAHPALGDPRVRQALLLALDRPRIVAQLFGGQHQVADSGVNPLDPMHDPDVRRWPHDPAAAAALLDDAGWRQEGQGVRRNAAGEALALELMTTAGNRSREQVQVVLAAMWRAVGIDVRIRNEPPRVLFAETLSKRRFQGMALFAWISAPENVPRGILHSAEIPSEAKGWSGQNYGGFRDAEFDMLLEALPETLEVERRRTLFARLQALSAERLPALPLWFQTNAHVLPPWLDGLRPTGNLSPTSLWVEDWRAR